MSEPFLEPPDIFEVCPDCCGEGVIGTGRMSWSVNSATIDPPYEITETCKTCNGSCYVDARVQLRPALEMIADIAEGSRTVNSLPHIAKIARAALMDDPRREVGGREVSEVPTCATTGLIAGHSDACGDCDPCGAAHLVPEPVRRLLAEANEWAERYSKAMEDREDLRACILNIQSLAEKGFPIDAAKLAARCRRALAQSPETAGQGEVKP